MRKDKTTWQHFKFGKLKFKILKIGVGWAKRDIWPDLIVKNKLDVSKIEDVKKCQTDIFEMKIVCK